MPYFYAFLFLLFLVALPTTTMAEPAVAYAVSIKGVKKPDILTVLRDSSDAIALKKKPPATLALLNLRVRADARRFRQLLDSLGYYAATVHPIINEKTSPTSVVFDILLGQPFVFSSITIASIPPQPSIIFPPLEKLGLKPGAIAEAKIVVAAQDTILRAVNEQGYPFAAMKAPDVVVDHKTHTMTVAFSLSPGPLAHFGPATIKGLTSIDRAFIAGKMPWKEGDRYTPALTEKYEKILNDSALFSITTVSKGTRLQENGQLPITITVKERPHRTIKTGVNYQTDEGPGVKLLWQHRNFFHHGEKVEISGSASAVKRTINNNFTRSDFLRHDQSLKLFYTLDNEDTEAYFSNNLSFGGAIERKVATPLATAPITFGIGTNYKLSHIKQITESGNFGLISFPLYANYDSRNILLDPSSGSNTNLQFTPYLNTLPGNSSFTKEYLSATRYFPFSSYPKLVLASRAALGLIQSPSTSNLPPNERFYAGGSGSVRGYGYQSLGPTTSGIPTGGLSLVEVSGEMRYKFSPKIGLVTFIDGGNSFSTPLPDIQDGIHFGVGMGVRYYTEIAPLRFDVGVPLNAQDTTSKPLQFYISLGQAF